MYTRCPECQTWFNVTETQLEVAGARVRCGQCLASFNAASRLWSSPDETSAPLPWKGRKDEGGLPGPAPSVERVPEPEPVAPPPGSAIRAEPSDRLGHPEPVRLSKSAFDAGPRRSSFMLEELDLDLAADGSGPALGDVGRVAAEVDLDVSLDAPGPFVGDVRRVTAVGSRPPRTATNRIHQERIATGRHRSREQAILNRIEGLDDRRGRGWALFWCIVLLLALAAQYTWFRSGELAANFPELVPAIEALCDATGCETEWRAGMDEVRVISRTVRPHAEYLSAVSVKATLENRAKEARPFPVVVFTLYGEDGRAVASRAFEPEEYIEGGIVPPGGKMESGNRIDIAFDLMLPREVWVSSELRLI